MSIEKNNKTYLYKRIVRAKLYIDEHYIEDIDMDGIAGEACLSKFHFLRLFKQIYGLTPHKYVTSLRINRAKELLRNGIAISDTCYSLGFESLSSFTKLFKRYSDVNPSIYSAKAKDINRQIAAAPLNFVPQFYIEYLHWDK